MNQPKSLLHNLLKTTVPWAIGLFLALNAGLSGLSHRLPVSSSLEERSATYQACDSAVRQFEESQKTPGCVLIGSSLVMAPLWSSDSLHNPGIADVYHHHRSIELEKALKANGISKHAVFCFALPGEMISDGYLITDKLLAGAKTPDILVYGLAPRDFMDDLLTGETRTAVFQRLTGLSDLPSLWTLYLATWSERADFTLSNLFYFYGKRLRYQDKLATICQRLAGKLMPEGADSASRLPGQLESQFLRDPDQNKVWARSIEEYRGRYRHFNQAQFAKQEQFLKALLELARSRGIRIALVNMPLTETNLALMPPGFYQRYLKTLSALASEYRCQILNLQTDSSYPREFFYDTAHLNARGGDRFISRLANWIGSQVRQSRYESSQQGYAPPMVAACPQTRSGPRSFPYRQGMSGRLCPAVAAGN